MLGAVAIVQLLVVRDSRAPLFLADDQGVRVRDGETWSGLRWSDIDHIGVTSSSSWLRDGEIVVHPREGDDAEAQSLVALTVPLGVTTRLRYDGLTGDLVSDLDALASGRSPVVVVTRLAEVPADEADETHEEPEADTEESPDLPDHAAQEEPPAVPEPERSTVVQAEVEVVVLGGTEGIDGLVLPRQMTAEERDEEEVEESAAREADPSAAPDHRPTPEPVEHFDPVDPGREPRPAARSEVVRDSVRALAAPIPAQRHDGASPVVVARVDDLEPHRPRPATEARIGPIVAAARNRARLSIDTLSDRTRIRPHVLECIEVDDFEPCGGDFYARGHLRTLARIFGLDPQELLALYDEHYASPEIEARQVFEAELATGIGGGLRSTSNGPRWSVLAAAVVALGMVWGVAHFFSDTPQEIVSPAPDVDSAGLTHASPAGAPKSTLAALGVTAVGASPQVVVRDRDGQILWAGKLAQGQHQQVIGLAPFDVTTSNGEAVTVTFLGKSRGTVGPTSAAGSKQFG